MVAEAKGDYPSEFAAIESVAGKLGIGSAENLRKWIRRAEVDAGQRPGVTTAARALLGRVQLAGSSAGCGLGGTGRPLRWLREVTSPPFRGTDGGHARRRMLLSTLIALLYTVTAAQLQVAAPALPSSATSSTTAGFPDKRLRR